jgi:hypothetical protein
MELVTEAELYSPGIDEHGNYIDTIPPFSHGLRCPCGSRKDKVYETHSIFASHIKTKYHHKWLAGLNTNKANYYMQSLELATTVQNQRLIIAKLEMDLQNKSMTIDYLTKQIMGKQTPTVANLLDL